MHPTHVLECEREILLERRERVKNLSDYLPYMQNNDVLAATEQAKIKARALLEDQGITVLALMLADFLADTIGQGALSGREAITPKTPILS